MSEDIATETPHYVGHRQRLKNRFIDKGAASLADYEILELLLFHVKIRGDVKPLAKELIRHFGSFAAVMAAEPSELMRVEGVGYNTMLLIKATQAASHLMQKQELIDKPILDSWEALIAYCHSVMAHEKVEQFRLVFLDGRNAVITDELQQRGTVNHTPVYVREVVKRVLEHEASAIIMIHNHPTGDPKPSREDIQMTMTIKQALEQIDVRLYDHIIVGKNGHSSMRTMGLLDKRAR